MLTTGAIVTTIIGWCIFIGVLALLFTRIGKGGKWED